MGTTDQTAKPPSSKGSTAAHAVVLLLLFSIVAILPFALGSVIVDVSDQADPVYRVQGSPGALTVGHADAHLQVIAMNEWDGTASIRISMHRYCEPFCPWTDRVLFVSAFSDAEDKDNGRPATEVVTLAPPNHDVATTIKLPVFGDPIRYPFDRYQLAMGVIVERVEDGIQRTLSPDEARDYLAVTLQGHIPRATMSAPERLPSDVAQTDPRDVRAFTLVELLHFERPFYLKVLTVLLVLLVTAAAAYAVFLRPLDQLIINSGALVLGVWGVRAILLGSDVNGITAVDLALATVIMFLLVTITVRTAYLLEEKSALRVMRRWREFPATAPPSAPSPSQPADNVPGDNASGRDHAESDDGVPTAATAEAQRGPRPGTTQH